MFCSLFGIISIQAQLGKPEINSTSRDTRWHGGTQSATSHIVTIRSSSWSGLPTGITRHWFSFITGCQLHVKRSWKWRSHSVHHGDETPVHGADRARVTSGIRTTTAILYIRETINDNGYPHSSKYSDTCRDMTRHKSILLCGKSLSEHALVCPILSAICLLA